MRRRIRIRKILFWGFLFIGSVLIGAIAFAYSYITDSETLAALVREEAPRYFPTSRVEVDRVLLRPLVGDIELKQTVVRQKVDGAIIPTLRIPWLQVRSDFRSLLSGALATREVVIAHPTLRVVKGKDGTWNLQGLLADPFPTTNLPKPVVTVSGGTVELADGKEVLNRVWMRIEPISDGSYKFEADARGTAFERVSLTGTFHPKTGRLVLTSGDLSALTLTESVRSYLPESWRAPLEKLGIDRGEVDVSIAHLVRDPKANPPLNYEMSITLREGVWKNPKLPFPLTDLSASATITPSAIRVQHAVGRDGKTIVRVSNATFSTMDPERGPMDATVRVEHLELDERLRLATPKLKKLWDDYSPPGRSNLGQVHATFHASRAITDGQIAYDLDADLLDVAIRYTHFKYPLEHIHGKFTWRPKQITIDAETVVGGRPLTGKGTIDHPGPNAIVEMTFNGESVPIDKTLLDALPEDARKVVDDFRPAGSVSGRALLTRTPLEGDPKGKVEVHADLDLLEGCSMRWKGMPYPIMHMTGHLKLHPNRWTFTEMKGRNNLAEIEAAGRVIQVSKAKFDVDISLTAKKLPFDDQLRESLPVEWQKTWGILNPGGTSSVSSHIVLVPSRTGVTGKNDYHIEITPDPGTHVQLKLTPAPGTETAGGLQVIQIPRMDSVTGKFVFDNGIVNMNDVGFTFRQAPARFTSGRVTLKDTGAFDLSVSDLSIKGLRLESELRSIMPPIMAKFARKLDDGKTFMARTDLKIGWTGAASEPAVCSWENARIVFNQNAIMAGIPIEHIQGEINNIRGRFDGRDLVVQGVIDLESVNIRGQHLTKFGSPLWVGEGRAVLSDIRADFLGGTLYGKVGVSLDVTPKYEANLKLVGARLEKLAQTIPGHQEYKGDVGGWADISGLGQDLKNVKGKGAVQVTNGDLGKLPIVLELLQPLSLPSQGRSKFDTANLDFTLDNGIATLDPIKLTSSAATLEGRGTVGHLGALDVRFTLLPGRDERGGLQGLTDAFRALEGQLVVVHIGGTATQIKTTTEFLPTVARGAGRMMKKMGERR